MKKLLSVLISAVCAVCAACVLCLALFAGGFTIAAAEDAPETTSEEVPVEDLPTVDPAEERVITYFGDCKIGHWLSVFDDSGNCTGYVSVVFSAAAPFHQFGLPVVWSGTDENRSSAECRFAIYEFKDDEETTMKGTPVFCEDIWFRHDSGYGIIMPMEKFLPAGKYMLVISQLTPRTEDTGPYIVIPLVSSLYSSNYLKFGGISDKPFAFYVDFLKTEGITEYFRPINNADVTEFHNDEPVKVTGDNEGGAHCINDEDFALLSPVIPDGKVLHTLTLLSAPTWSNNGTGSNMSFTVYKWNSNYETTLKGDPVYGGTVKDHKDCADLELDFADRLEGGSQYLIVLRGIGPKQIGFWNAKYKHSAGWNSYLNGERVSSELMPSCSYTTATVEIIPAATEDVPGEEGTPSGGDPAATPSGSQSVDPSSSTGPSGTSSPSGGKGCGGSLITSSAVLLPLFFAGLLTIKKRRSM